MAAISTIIAAVGLGIAAAGTAMSIRGQQQQAKYAKQSLAAQRQAEEIRRQQMNLDAIRRRREIARQSQLAQAQALAIGTAQGTSGSGLEGALAGISGQAGVATQGSVQAQDLGNRIFDANAMASYYQGKGADAQSFTAIGSSLSSLGGGIIKNQDTIGNLYRQTFNRPMSTAG